VQIFENLTATSGMSTARVVPLSFAPPAAQNFIFVRKYQREGRSAEQSSSKEREGVAQRC